MNYKNKIMNKISSGKMKVMDYYRYENCPKYVNMEALNEKMAMEYHQQPLETLNRRGGMGIEEIYANVKFNDDGTYYTRKKWEEVLKIPKETILEFVRSIATE